MSHVLWVKSSLQANSVIMEEYIKELTESIRPLKTANCNGQTDPSFVVTMYITRSSSRLLITQKHTFWFHKRQGTSRLARILLTSQERFCSPKLISRVPYIWNTPTMKLQNIYELIRKCNSHFPRFLQPNQDRTLDVGMKCHMYSNHDG
jgi:hypothetical protein